MGIHSSGSGLPGSAFPLPASSAGKNRSFVAFFSCLICFFSICLIATSCKNKPKNAVEAALIDSTWQKIFDACKKDDSLLKKSETIGIIGHAAIMLNKNNISYVLLSSIDADNKKRKEWQSWTDNFVLRFPNAAVAWYLQGDAYMRNGNKEKSLDCFNKAIDIDPKFVLAYNARGVLYAIKKKKNHISDDSLAVSDFNRACSLAPQIADFRVNRGTMYFNNKKAPEGAADDFATAIKISHNDALALNGKACSILFCTPKPNTKENTLDSISKYFFLADSNLNLFSVQENKRSLILELENRIFPEQTETPFFRVSDFFSWNILQKLAHGNKYDPFGYLLKKDLPTEISILILNYFNSLLDKPDLFADYLLDKNVPDSLKSIIEKTKNTAIVTGKTEKEKSECINRLIFEKLYSGLIASYRDRKPGMSLASQSSYQTRLQDMQSYQSQLQDIKSSARNFEDNIKGLGGFAFSVGAQLTKFPPTAEFGLGLMGFGGAVFVGMSAKEMVDDMKSRYNIGGPGGALANIRLKYTDDDKPYPFICTNTLCYDVK